MTALFHFLFLLSSIVGGIDHNNNGTTLSNTNNKKGHHIHHVPRKRRNESTFYQDLNPFQINFPSHFMSLHSDWRAKPFQDELVILEDYNSWEHFAQDGEDVWMYENFFYGMIEGVIIESGALDGLRYSTTYMFEKYLNWTAIHIEADPNNFKGLVENRKNSINVQAGLCSKSAMLHYVNSEAVGGFVELMSDSFFRSWFPDIWNNETAINALPLIPCLPMRSLLHVLGLKHVDIWVLDVEGAEQSVLESTDFSQVHVSFICMECDGSDPEKDQWKINYLNDKGFLCKLFKGLGGGGIQNCMCRNNRHQNHHHGFQNRNGSSTLLF